MPPQISLRVLRERQKLTLSELASQICAHGVNITANGLNNAELGRKPASEMLLDAWANVLGVDRRHIRTGPQIIQWVNAVQAEVGCACEANCTCGAGLPRNRRMARSSA